jgi:methyl-accepting chemotaxis protein
MAKLNLSTKLISGFMLMGLILLIGGLLGPYGISRLGGELKEVSEVHFPAIHSLGTMIEAQKTIQRAKQSLLIPELFSDETERGHLFQRLDQAWGRAEKGKKVYETLPRSKEGEVLWSNLKPTWETWMKSHQEVINLLKEGKRIEAVALSAGRERESFVQAERLLMELSNFNLKLSEKAKQTGLDMEVWQKRLVTSGTAAGIVIALLFGFFFAGSITKSVYRCIKNLSETCAQFAATSEQIASSSNQLAGGTSIQAAAVEETSSVTEQLSSIIQRNTEDVDNLKTFVEESGVRGMEAFDKFIKAKKALKEIKISSEETSKIVKTISEIAFQTSLLALSASIEAAQTNKVGIGFSVVAQEVRNLARRSTEASKNTSALIEETIRLINRGDDLVRASLGSFIAYGDASKPISGFSGTASEVARKQAQGIEQINIAIGEISRTSQINATSARESASVAQELTAQTNSMTKILEELKKVVGDRG